MSWLADGRKGPLNDGVGSWAITGKPLRNGRCRPAGLGVGGPIGRRERYAPEPRCGPCEFHGNRWRPCQFLIHRDYAALFLLPAACVLQKQSLLGSYHSLQGHQRAMRADHQCPGTLIKFRTFPRRSVDNYGNVQFNPLAPPVFRPALTFIQGLVVHTSSE